jgi:hypothetical protein
MTLESRPTIISSHIRFVTRYRPVAHHVSSPNSASSAPKLFGAQILPWTTCPDALTGSATSEPSGEFRGLKLSDCAGRVSPMNDRQFRQHIAMLVERKRWEAEGQAQAEVQKGPPATAKAKKSRKKRSA